MNREKWLIRAIAGCGVELADTDNRVQSLDMGRSKIVEARTAYQLELLNHLGLLKKLALSYQAHLSHGDYLVFLDEDSATRSPKRVEHREAVSTIERLLGMGYHGSVELLEEVTLRVDDGELSISVRMGKLAALKKEWGLGLDPSAFCEKKLSLAREAVDYWNDKLEELADD